MIYRIAYLLLPALELFDQEVVSFGDLSKYGVHATLEVDEVLPSFLRVTGVLVALPHNLIEMAHGNLGHQRLLDRASEDGLNARVSALLYIVSFPYKRNMWISTDQLLAHVIHDRHDCILSPPIWVLDALHFTTHHDNLSRRDELTATVSRSQMLWNTSRRHFPIQGLCQTGDHLASLPSCEGGRRA